MTSLRAHQKWTLPVQLPKPRSIESSQQASPETHRMAPPRSHHKDMSTSTMNKGTPTLRLAQRISMGTRHRPPSELNPLGLTKDSPARPAAEARIESSPQVRLETHRKASPRSHHKKTSTRTVVRRRQWRDHAEIGAEHQHWHVAMINFGIDSMGAHQSQPCQFHRQSPHPVFATSQPRDASDGVSSLTTKTRTQTLSRNIDKGISTLRLAQRINISAEL